MSGTGQPVAEDFSALRPLPQINWAAAVSRLRDIVGEPDTPYSCEGN